MTRIIDEVCSFLFFQHSRMRIFDVIRQLLPAGTVSGPGRPLGNLDFRSSPSYQPCPTWPPDLFAVVGTIIDRSGCYTLASPNRDDLQGHEVYLQEVQEIAKSWKDLLNVPTSVQELWIQLVTGYAEVTLESIKNEAGALKTLLALFAISDEVSEGMGWDADISKGEKLSDFATAVLIVAAEDSGVEPLFELPDWPTSLCRMVPSDSAIVLPKSITTDKGCTIRSLSHNLALLPCRTVLDPEWRLVSRKTPGGVRSALRLLLIPFPYEIPDGSFVLTSARQKLANGSSHAAFFGLKQNWLSTAEGGRHSGEDLARNLILPLIEAAKVEAGGQAPHGVVLPECALDDETTVELVDALRGSGVEFLITGVLERDEVTGRSLNQAYTLFMDSNVAKPQNKQHRWRINKAQADSYGLGAAFDPSPDNHQWWEDIDVNKRSLPFFAFRKDTSMVTLICEDLARMDPAMNAIRAVGPNLVVALLMDGPQLGARWPGRYASVLADEPGCSVLSLTCAATVDSSNAHFSATTKPLTPPQRIIARWTQTENVCNDLVLPDGANGVLLCLQSVPKHQTTLDNRPDYERARELKFVSQHPLMAGKRPDCGA